jgi:hypothetical protein
MSSPTCTLPTSSATLSRTRWKSDHRPVRSPRQPPATRPVGVVDVKSGARLAMLAAGGLFEFLILPAWLMQRDPAQRMASSPVCRYSRGCDSPVCSFSRRNGGVLVFELRGPTPLRRSSRTARSCSITKRRQVSGFPTATAGKLPTCTDIGRRSRALDRSWRDDMRAALRNSAVMPVTVLAFALTAPQLPKRRRSTVSFNHNRLRELASSRCGSTASKSR